MCIIYHPRTQECTQDTTSMGDPLYIDNPFIIAFACIRCYKYGGPPVSYFTHASKPVHQILQVYSGPPVSCIYHPSIKACVPDTAIQYGDNPYHISPMHPLQCCVYQIFYVSVTTCNIYHPCIQECTQDITSMGDPLYHRSTTHQSLCTRHVSVTTCIIYHQCIKVCASDSRYVSNSLYHTTPSYQDMYTKYSIYMCVIDPILTCQVITYNDHNLP